MSENFVFIPTPGPVIGRQYSAPGYQAEVHYVCNKIWLYKCCELVSHPPPFVTAIPPTSNLSV